jgi:hypothetical protein
MAASLDLALPHSLGTQEAKRRIQRALEEATARYSSVVTFSETRWTDSQLAFSAAAMAQSVRGLVEVSDSEAKLHVDLPLLLRPFAAKLQGFLTRKGAALLGRGG